uniref:Uncharacterized protein n=1 Tax=Rhabditophanes sp. KR3021 TaxID=114890 RepID=A0AC35UG27_9BILA
MNADQEKVKDSEHLQPEKEQVECVLEATLIKLMKPCRKQTSPPSEPAQQFLDIFEPSQSTRQIVPTISKHVHFELSKDPQMSWTGSGMEHMEMRALIEDLHQELVRSHVCDHIHETLVEEEEENV